MQRFRALLAIAGFRRYWLGLTLSHLGDEISRVALIWLVWERSSSPAAIGLLMVCFTAPILVGGFLAGWLLDRFDRRLILLLDNVFRAGIVAIVPLLAALDALALWHLYGIAALHGLLMMLPLAGTPTLIPGLVPAELRNTANAAEMLGYTLGGALGPALGGLLIAAIGAPLAILLDAVSYLLFAACLLGIPPSPPPRAAAQRQTRTLGAVAKLLVGQPILASTTVMFLLWNIGSGAIAVWLPVLAERQLGGGPELYGLLAAAQSAGQLLSILAIGAMPIAGRLGQRICFAQALSGLALLALLPAIDHAAAVGLALMLFGVCSAPLTIWAQTLRMQLVPDDMRGRAFALMRTIMQGGRPLGGLLAGLAISSLALSGTVALSALLAGLPGLLGLLVRPLRRVEIDR